MLGFGEEIKQILIGVAGVLKAVPEATIKIAEGIVAWLARNKFKATVSPNGEIVVEANITGEPLNAAEITEAVAKLLKAQRG